MGCVCVSVCARVCKCVRVSVCACGVCQLSTFVRRFACEMLILLGLGRTTGRIRCSRHLISANQKYTTHTHTHSHNGNLTVRVQNSISDICKCHNSQLS